MIGLKLLILKKRKKAKVKYTLDEELNKHYLIDKSSITNVENIVL